MFVCLAEDGIAMWCLLIALIWWVVSLCLWFVIGVFGWYCRFGGWLFVGMVVACLIVCVCGLLCWLVFSDHYLFGRVAGWFDVFVVGCFAVWVVRCCGLRICDV